ncbi:putative N-formylglutamate amidohydrolase [Litoreibacter halocynthiae]|uniref:Putative N-formylglutamate amidohydrolase n=1 Tax=Litoreibacter halocynthiae TaxID=1242689 RepID=A0A4R7LNT4_9RHOB|nr:N-formylglutamate amidohydrolase [Litoreibacter halocynthiae]TDT77404.1 putative N-formylglutamate amidohydrolase [Litoreibacter halocynthiae]
MSRPVTSKLLDQSDGPAFEVINRSGQSPVVLVCEHAANRVPAGLDNLGLTEEQLEAHVAWDPGASALARRLSDTFDAPLVEARFSRLVYDCNRSPDAPSAMPADTEFCTIPGNAHVTEADRAARTKDIYEPFHAAVAKVLAETPAPVLVTIHSFTPVFHGKTRDVEIGLLHAEDTRLAHAMMPTLESSAYDARYNAPYGPEDGVLHSIEKHLSDRRLPYVMIEVRNDLLATDAGLSDIATLLTRSLTHALSSMGVPHSLANPDVSDAK